jgi:hypothetical protein
VKLLFDYAEGMTKKNDLTVCLSRKNKEPSPTNSEKVFNRPTLASLESIDHVFPQPYLYLGLYSDSGVTFNLKVLFPKDD